MNLRLLIDQNIPAEICPFIIERRPHWLVKHVADVGLWGASDKEILAWAQPDRWTIVTYDEDFADARMFPVGSHAGVIRLRVWPTTVEITELALERLLREVPDEALAGSLVIVDAHQIRVRRTARHG